MKNPVPLSFTCRRAAFTLVVAPMPVLTGAIAAALAKRKDPGIGITGPWASVLPSVPVGRLRFPRRAVPSLAALQELVGALPQRFVVIEDSPLLHDEERAVPFWWACHAAAHERGATVIVVATQHRPHLAGAAEIADKAFFMQTIPALSRPLAPDQQMIGGGGGAGDGIDAETGVGVNTGAGAGVRFCAGISNSTNAGTRTEVLAERWAP
jgi:hypothetical protein